MVFVCDEIMGSGKSSAAINYINSHQDKRFIYITPYLDETVRIKNACPNLHFMLPSNRLKEFDFKKSEHTKALIRLGKNIATTHQSFKMYTKETLNDIRRLGYTLIIDENVDVLETFECADCDIEMAKDGGFIDEDYNGVLRLTELEYDGSFFMPLVRALMSRDIIRFENGDESSLFFWTLPIDLLLAFDDVIILTFMFDCQSLHHFLEINNMPYEYIYVDGIKDKNKFEFTNKDCGMTKNAIYNIKNKIRLIDEDSKLNAIGDNIYALSANWYKKNSWAFDDLKKNLSNFFNNVARGVNFKKRLWSAFAPYESKLKGKGFANSFLPFNARAMNSYGDRTVLAYMVNVFLNVNEKIYYKTNGIDVSDDKFAVSTMLQWIFRSAVRNNEEILLYLPSKRMRELLVRFLNDESI